jgi:hypothetical protein
MEQRSWTWKGALKVRDEEEDAKPLTMNERFFNLSSMVNPRPLPTMVMPKPAEPIRLDELAIRYEATVRDLEHQLFVLSQHIAGAAVNTDTRKMHHQATEILLRHEREERHRS